MSVSIFDFSQKKTTSNHEKSVALTVCLLNILSIWMSIVSKGVVFELFMCTLIILRVESVEYA